MKKIEVVSQSFETQFEAVVQKQCECEGTGWIAVADNGGDDVEYVECAEHNEAYQDPRLLK